MECGAPVWAVQGTTERQGGGRENHEQYMWRGNMALEQRGMSRDCREKRASMSLAMK
jgi:hypothetical protein